MMPKPTITPSGNMKNAPALCRKPIIIRTLYPSLLRGEHRTGREDAL